MVRVKIIKDNAYEFYKNYVNDGKVYEALEYNDGIGYYIQFSKTNVSFVEAECVEVVEDCSKSKPKHKILLVEDGSVDVDYIAENFDIKCIVYRQGANKPEWLEVNNE